MPPITEGIYNVYNSEEFFIHFFLMYFHSPSLSVFSLNGNRLLLLLLSRFSRVRLCATPQMVAH